MAKLTDGKAGAAVAESVVNLGRALSLTVVIEGVETAEQVALLEAISSEPLLQGFFFAEPLEPVELEALIVTEADLQAVTAAKSKARAKRSPKLGAVTSAGSSSAPAAARTLAAARRRSHLPAPS